MSHPPNDIPEHVSVVCPTCKTRLKLRIKNTSRNVTCSNCFSDVRVPSRDQVRAKPKTKQQPENAGYYALAEEAGARVEVPDSVEIICPTCGARLHPDVEETARRIQCPDCFVEIRVPAIDELPRKPSKKRRPPSVGRIALGKARNRPRLRTGLINAQAEIRREATDPPPRWTFFSGVFTYPWRREAIARWGFLSLGCTAVGLVAAVVVSVYSTASGGSRFGMVLAFLMLPAIWLSIWTFSYAAACCITILEETAAGNDRVHGWPEPNWREWAPHLMYVAYIGLMVAAVAYGAFLGVDALGGEGWTASVATIFLLYPIFLLSSLEAGSPWTPLSAPIMHSLLMVWRGWLLFYLLSAALWGVWLTTVLLGIRMLEPFLTFLSTGPMLAAIFFIYARLLGRLAWRASVESAR